MKRDDGTYAKKPYISNQSETPSNPQVGWTAVGVALILVLAFDYLPSNLFSSGNPDKFDTRSESGGGPYSENSNNIQTRLHALNETGIIMARDQAFHVARNAVKEDHNRAFLAIDQLSKNMQSGLNHTLPNGKTIMQQSTEDAGKVMVMAENEAVKYQKLKQQPY